MTETKTLCAALVVALSLIAAASGAEPATQPSATAGARLARDLFQRAELHYRLREFRKALVDYQAVLKLRHHPNILFNIAQCFRQLDQPDKALFFYKLFIADWGRVRPGTLPPNNAEVQEQIGRLEEKIRAREELRRREHARERPRGDRGAPAGPPKSYLALEGLELVMARVLVDGEHRAMTPIKRPLVVKPGRLRITVEADGYLPWSRYVTVKPGQEATVRVALRARPRRSRLWLAGTIASLALASGAEALAIVFARRANEHYRGTPPFEQDRTVSIAGHAAAGAFAALGVASLVLYLRSGRVEQPAAAALVPQTGGVAAVGRVVF